MITAWTVANLWRLRGIGELMRSLAAVPIYAGLALWLVGIFLVSAEALLDSDLRYMRYPDERRLRCLCWAERLHIVLWLYHASILILGYVHFAVDMGCG